MYILQGPHESVLVLLNLFLVNDYCAGRYDGFYPDPNSCARFINCQDGVIVSTDSCSGEHLYNAINRNCDDASNVVCYSLQGQTCFGAKGGTNGKVTVSHTGLLRSIILMHVRGIVTCDKNRDISTFWGCNREGSKFAIWLTTAQDRNGVIFPDNSISVDNYKFYNLPGETNANSTSIVINSSSYFMQQGEELRIWYSEDLFGITEVDNDGESCVEVWANLVPST